nr:hypothetical protein [uncultured Pedobacter sp.]
MNYSIKRKIAKEVIIFFSCVCFLGVSWFGLWAINYFNYYNRDNIKKQITYLNYKRDSLKSTFPKLKSFEDVIVNKSDPFDPNIYIYKARINRVKSQLPSFEELNEMNPKLKPWENASLRKLYILLEILQFPVTVKHINTNRLSVLTNFKKATSYELEGELKKMSELKRVHHFLQTKKYMTVPFNEFISSLKGLPLPPPHSTWKTYETTKKQIAQLNQQLIKSNSKIYSKKDLSHVGKWLIIIVFMIVYPLRYLILTLIWALGVLNKKST